MNRAVKTLAFITIFTFLSSSINAQLKLPLVKDPVAKDVRKVIADYPFQFTNITGELLVEHHQSSDYACNFEVAGAEDVTITRYSTKKGLIGSWQAIMLTTEDFGEAAKEYKSIFSQLNNISIKTSASSSYTLRGEFIKAEETKKFAASILSFQQPSVDLKKLKVEVQMVYELLEWKVKLMIYDREREDHERGNTEE